MSPSLSEVASAFSTPEDALLLNLLQYPLFDNTAPIPETVIQAHPIRWEHFLPAYFIQPYLHLLFQRLAPSVSLPGELKIVLYNAFIDNYHKNRSRLATIREVAQGVQTIPARLLFIKGAAEIALSKESLSYLGTRMLGDIDMVCLREDLPAIDNHLTETGNELYDYGNKERSREEIQWFSMATFGHYVYNAYQVNHLELHEEGSFPINSTESYPPWFSRKLFTHAQTVELDEVPAEIPSKEDMFLNLICHASSIKDNHLILTAPALSWDYGWSVRPSKDNLARLQARMDVQQIRFLFQVKAFLELHSSGLDWTYVKDQLSQISYRPLIEMYQDLIDYALFPDGSFQLLGRNRTLADIRQTRLEYILQHQSPDST